MDQVGTAAGFAVQNVNAATYTRCFIKGTFFLSFITQSNDDQFTLYFYQM